MIKQLSIGHVVIVGMQAIYTVFIYPRNNDSIATKYETAYHIQILNIIPIAKKLAIETLIKMTLGIHGPVLDNRM